MLKKIKTWIDKHKMIGKGDKILIACSGGPDSLALLHIFHEFCAEYNISIFAAHVDHMFRGRESAEEADFVLDFCKMREIECYYTAIDVPKYIEETGLSGQEAARIVRYQYLRRIAKQLGCTKIATGHHRDDQAETVLMNILRGSGGLGIRGIQPMNGDVIHPLLPVSRADITQYCKEHQLEPRIDSSNLTTKYLRNRIRMLLLPELEKQYNMGIKEALCRTGTLVGDEHDFIQMTAQHAWDRVITKQADGLVIAEKEMKTMHIAIQREIFRMAIEHQRGHLTGISFYHVESLIELLCAGRVGSIVELPGGLTACKEYERIIFTALQALPLANVNPIEQRLEVPGVTAIPELNITIKTEIINDAMDHARQPNVGVFDWSVLKEPLLVRTRRDGDRFAPLGFYGSKKLKSFFIDAKIPKLVRDCTPIICAGQDIIWVGGYRQSQLGKITEQTVTFLKITIIKMQTND